jgi:hypothetical protein
MTVATLTKNISDVVQSSKLEHTDLNSFLSAWDADYEARIKSIDLFNRSIAQNYTTEQIQYFIKIFYHARGHFKDFLWHLGNYAPNKNLKDIILENIEEEFGDTISHEQLYIDFATQMGVDLTDVMINREYYLPEIKAFNEGHVRWSYAHCWDAQFASFSAYERLDSTDYEALTNLFPNEHLFFKIHRKAKHFDKTYEELLAIWDRDPTNIYTAFDFITKTQTKMWQDLSIAIAKV